MVRDSIQQVSRMFSKHRHVRFRLASLATTSLLVLALGVSGCANKRLTTGSVGPRTSKPIEQMTSAELGSATASFTC